jgi:chemotaxis protein MotB
MRRSLLDDDSPDSPDQAPVWMVSYGDMMSLLLTLFVMLVSMSEIKQNDKFQGVADSLHEQFSFNRGAAGSPDDVLPRNAALAGLAVAGRQTRQAVLTAGVVRNVSQLSTRTMNRAIAHRAIAFEPASAEILPEAQQQLQAMAEWAREPNPIELLASAAGSDDLERAWERAHATADRLVSDCGIEPHRLRFSIAVTAGANGTSGTAGTSEKPMVDVFLLRAD